MFDIVSHITNKVKKVGFEKKTKEFVLYLTSGLTNDTIIHSI